MLLKHKTVYSYVGKTSVYSYYIYSSHTHIRNIVTQVCLKKYRNTSRMNYQKQKAAANLQIIKDLVSDKKMYTK